MATWDDDAPVPHDAIQGSAGARPSLGTLGGGGPAVVFDGTNDFLGHSDTLTLAGTAFTVALAYRVTALPAGSFGALCDFKLSTGTFDLLVMDLGGYTDLSFVKNTGAMVGANAAYDTSAHYLVITNDGAGVAAANWDLWVDGSPVTVINSGAAGVGSGTALGARAGGASYLACEIAAALVLDGEADGATVALVNTWLQGQM